MHADSSTFLITRPEGPVSEGGTHLPALALRRALFWGLVVATAGAGSWMMLGIVGAGGLSVLEAVILALFVPTFTWIVVPFWTAVAGFVLELLGRDPLSLARRKGHGRRGDTGAETGALAGQSGSAAAGSSPAAPLSSRTALAVPIYNEDPEAVSARLSALLTSLETTGQGSRFELHLLSDTRDPAVARAEEGAFALLQATHPEMVLHYRRREENTGRKAGNIREFLDRRADDFDFMVVLDADSLMSGETLVTLARRMEANPRLGLLQTVPLPARQDTLFGRLIQFAAALYAPMLASGAAFWQGETANYWGHNAIVRVRAFHRHAHLPWLPGTPPLGGQILSHDFVEAALLRRAGWEVVLDPTLGGSWEEVPGTVVDFARRDRRWAQGSLQHLRLLGIPGLHWLSRIHFALGAMGYVASLLWLLTLLAGTAYIVLPPTALLLESPPVPAVPLPGISLLGATALLLFLPKGLGLGLALLRRRRAFGGVLHLGAGALLETLFSVLLAPVMMVYHARAVTEILAGRAVEWTAQDRDGSTLAWGDALRAGLPATLLGAAWTAGTVLVSPVFALWMSPILAGLLLSVPLIRLTSRPGLGRALRRRGFLASPSEVAPSPELQQVARRLDAAPGSGGAVPDFTGDLPAASGVFPSDQVLAHRRGRNAETTMYNAERALFDLRRGRPVLVTDDRETGAEHRIISSVEHLDDLGYQRLRRLADGDASLVVTPHRAATMGLKPAGSNGVTPSWAMTVAADTAPEVLYDLAAGRVDELELPDEPMHPAARAEAAGLALAHLGRILPAVVAFPVDDPHGASVRELVDTAEVLSVGAGEVEAFVSAAEAEVVRVSDAPVPLPGAEDSHFILFREAFGLAEHVAILVGDPASWPDPVPVRLHSACLTGDLFGSLRCDCGEQLRGSMAHFASRSGGILLYLAQEGRGIGLSNKFRAYSLQETGLDTIDADGTLGFGADERRYDVAVRILESLGVGEVELLTNNPEKVDALERAGIAVARRRPLHGSLNRHNLPYVRAKVHRAGHWLQDMLAQPLAGD